MNAASSQELDALKAQLATISAQLGTLGAQLEKAEREREEYRKLYALLREENQRLKHGLLGQKAERLPKNDEQLSLAMLGLMLNSAPRAPTESAPEAAAPEPETPKQRVAEHERQQPKRKPLPEHLARVRIEVVPTCVLEDPDAYEVIGEERRETLEKKVGETLIVETIRKKYRRKVREADGTTKVYIAEPPELPIEKGIAGPGFLADTIVRRFQDHQPLHRLEGIYARDGLELSKSTICGWHQELAVLAAPLIAAMKQDAFTLPYLCTDATGVLVQAPERCKNGHFWVLVAPEKHVLFEFSMKHDSAAVDGLLEGYEGYLLADAHSVYNHLYKDGAVVEVGCWAHCRRYFIKALESDPSRAKAALAHIASLFRVERTIADEPRKKRETVRTQRSGPIVDAFFAWCDAERDLVLDESPIAKAIGYARNQRDALRRFLDDGRLPLDNNISERNLRREAVGRKNWLFVGSEEGARANTTFVSLLASCAMHGLEPWSYLRDLFCLLPSWPKSRVLELAPVYFKQTLENPEAWQRLEANSFRKAALALVD